MLSVHSVYEHIAVAGEPRARAPVIATNIFLRTERGWRMVAHHASPAPAARRASRSRGARRRRRRCIEHSRLVTAEREPLTPSRFQLSTDHSRLLITS